MVSLIHIPSGITLFSRIFDKFCEGINQEFEFTLIGSFITAIKMFSQKFGQNEIKQIEMSSLRFLIYEQKRVMIFFLLNISDDILEYKRSLRICMNAFLQMFHKDIYKNYNNTAIFQDFNPILQEILKISLDKIEPSCLNCPMGQRNNCLFKRVKNKIIEFNENQKKKLEIKNKE